LIIRFANFFLINTFMFYIVVFGN